MAAEELVVTLSKRNDSSGLGFSLLGLSGLPHVIYDIVEHSAAADSGQVEAGDIILRINDADVSRLTTKEVLKCLRLSKDPVRLTLKRDPVLKAKVLCHITSPHTQDADDMCELISSTSSSSSSSPSSHSVRSSKIPRLRHAAKHNNGSAIPARSSSASVTSPVLKERNGSDTLKNTSSADKGGDKNEIVWEPLGGPAEKQDKSGPPRFEAYMMTGDLILNLSRTQQSSLLPKHNKKVDSLLLRHHHNYRNHQHHNSVPTSPNESDLGIKGHNLDSPTCNSAGASPVGTSKHEMFQESSSTTCSSKLLTYHNSVRTSRSDDQLQKDCSISTVDIDIDEDVTSSLNTLLDTKVDSGHCSEMEYPKSRMDKRVDIKLLNDKILHDQTCSNLIKEEGCLSDCMMESSYDHQSEFNATSEVANDCKATSNGARMNENDHSSSICQDSITFKDSSNSQLLEDLHSEFRDSHGSDSLAYQGKVDHIGSGSGRRTLDLIQTHGDRIVWTYNAPDWWIRLHGDRLPTSIEELEQCQRQISSSSSGGSDSTHEGVGSPTSISSSVMSSNSCNINQAAINPVMQRNGDLSQSEAVSNISSPDFQEEETLDILSARDLLMEGSDPSDSDSTLMASIPRDAESKHRIVIEVKGPDKDGNSSPQRGKNSRPQIYQELRENEESPPLSGSEDESDIESLHSYHYSPKGVDLPSAIRLAKRLYTLDGFKKSDISKHLCKNNDFSRAVAEEYLKHFDFSSETLDVALRKFLRQFSLTGETQERERVLVHFSKRYLDCNPGSFNSQDAVHTLTCAIMLLNTDLHTQNVGRKMSCAEFIENLAELNDGDNFSREVLKLLYQAIKVYPLEWALDGDGEECIGDSQGKSQLQQQQTPPQRGQQGGLGSFCNLGMNPFLDVPNAASAIEYKKGYVMRKCCIDPNGKRTPFGKRGWRMFCCTLRDMVLYLHKDEHGFRKNQLSDNLHNAIRIHHALATKATDYTKKQHVFRLQTADQAEYLFQTSDSKELQSWIDTINFVCASFSSQPLASAVGSQRKFQRPLLPCSHTKLNLREQLRDHEERVLRIESELEEMRKSEKDSKSNKSHSAHSHKERDFFLQHELKRYKTYAYLLRSRMSQYPELVEPLLEDGRFAEAITEEDSPCLPPSNRYSYRAAIYNSSLAGPGRSSVDSYAAELG